MRDRGWRFDSGMPSWVHPSPEHWQPTDGENDTADFIDKCEMPYSDLEGEIAAAGALWMPPEPVE